MASNNARFGVLGKPLESWLTAVVYVVGWIVLLCMVAFIGLKYWEILRGYGRQPANTTVLNPRYRRRFAARTPFPSPARPSHRSPLSQVTSASSSYFSDQSSASSIDQESQTRPRQRLKIARWRLAPGWVNIGPVEQGRIAKRRRASSAT